MRIRIQLITLMRIRKLNPMRNRSQVTQMMYLRNSRVKEASQTRLRRRLATRLLPTRTHRAQGEGGIGRGRGTDTPRAKSVTNTIYRQKFAIFAQGEWGRGRGRGTDTPRAKSVTNTIYRQKFAIFMVNARRVGGPAYEDILEFYPGRHQVAQFTCVRHLSMSLCVSGSSPKLGGASFPSSN